jgi:hypothetical protein
MTNKPMCVLCNVPLYKGTEDYQWICTKDKAHKYQFYAEVMAYDNEFSTIFSEEEENEIELAGLDGVGEPILLCGEDNFKREENDPKKFDIKIPKYFKDSETTKVTEYHES